MRKGLRILAAVLAALCLMMPGALAATMHREVENPKIEIEASLGYDGAVTYGKPMPVRVFVRNLGEDFDGVLGMNCYINKTQYDRYERKISLPSGAEKEVVLPIQLETRQEVFTLELCRDGEVVRAVNLKAGRVINPSDMLVGVLSAWPEQLKNLDISQDTDTLMRYEYWQTVPLTAETFPAEEKLLNAFGMLVVDDIDPAALSEEQHTALETWLKNGHILLCGGGSRAAKNVAYFSGLTGLQAGPVSLSDDVPGALEELLGLVKSETALRTAVAEITGGTPLARDGEGRGLLFRSQAGAGAIYTMAFEAGDRQLNTTALMHTFWQQLLVREDAALYNRALYYQAEYTPAVVAVNRPVEVKSPILPAVLIAAAVPMAGLGLWLLLKKKDKQQWMWLALPVLAAGAACAVAGIAGGSDLNQPMMVSATTLVQEENAPARSFSGITLAAPLKGSYRLSTSGAALEMTDTNYYYYDTDDGAKVTEPTRLRTCRTEGEENAVSVEVDRPWTQVRLSMEREADLGGRVEASIWMEADGLHGEILNGTAWALQEGWVLTGYGYAGIPALAPGEKTGFALVRTDGKAANSSSGTMVYEAGCMYENRDGSVYAVINSAVYGTLDPYAMMGADTPEAREKDTLYTLMNGLTDQIRQDKTKNGGKAGSVEQRTDFVYVARPEGLPETELKLNGKPVEKKSEDAMLGAEIPCLAEGPTGVVFYAAGMLSPERCDIDSALMPAGAAAEAGGNRNTWPLSDCPTFRFTVPGIREIRLDRLRVVFESYYANTMKGYALNAASREWEEIALNTDLEGAERYFDEEGRIYLQFRPLTGDSYQEIPAPSMSLEGRREHAEN